MPEDCVKVGKKIDMEEWEIDKIVEAAHRVTLMNPTPEPEPEVKLEPDALDYADEDKR